MDLLEVQKLIKAEPERTKDLSLRLLLKFDLSEQQEDDLLLQISNVEDSLDEAELDSEELVDLLEYLRNNRNEKGTRFIRQDWLSSYVSEVAAILYGSNDFVNTARVAILCCLQLGSNDSTFFINNTTTTKKMSRYLKNWKEPTIVVKGEEATPQDILDRVREILVPQE